MHFLSTHGRRRSGFYGGSRTTRSSGRDTRRAFSKGPCTGFYANCSSCGSGNAFRSSASSAVSRGLSYDCHGSGTGDVCRLASISNNRI